MARRPDPDLSLRGVPSLSALKAFLAAAKYGSFTDGALALCLSQAAVSKQVRELESLLGLALFRRTGRVVVLTPDGLAFRDAALLSFSNLAQATERLRHRAAPPHTLTIGCSPAFSSLWLQPRISEFFIAYPDCEVLVLATPNFHALEAGVRPDIMLATLVPAQEGYDCTALFSDRVYPVCAPAYLHRHGPLSDLATLGRADLLDVHPFGRAQISEHLDWRLWFELQNVGMEHQEFPTRRRYTSNDYPAVVQLALSGQGVALGWHHLVAQMVDSGALVRPVPQELSLPQRSHYLAVRRDRSDRAACQQFCDWIRQQCSNF